MASRVIDGPNSQFLGTIAAAKWLGVSRPTFRRLVGLDQHELTIPGIREWMRPNMLGRWNWFDLVVLAHIIARREGSPPPEGDEK